MGRPRTDLGPRADARIKALLRTGGTAESIAAALRAEGIKGVSVRTVGRRIRELRGDVSPRPKRTSRSSSTSSRSSAPANSSPAPPLPPSPDQIPEGADLQTIDRWIEIAEKRGRDAEAVGNLPGVGTMGRLVVALLEAKRKAMPPEEPDPNDNPDMRKLAEQVVERLHHYIDRILVP